MQTETTATDTTTATAQTVDTTTVAATDAQTSAAAATTTDADTSTTTETAGDDSSKQQEQDRNDKGQYKSGIQKRIDDLTFRRNQAEREAAHWRGVAESRAAPAAPKPADFDSDEAYDAALLEHRIDSGVNKGLARTAEEQAAKFNREAQNAVAETYNQRVAAAQAAIPDFVDVVGKSDVVMTPALQEALMDSDKGPELVYHLAKNPAEAERLNGLSDRQMNREIGRLEATLGTTTTTKAAPTPPAARTTTAPPPATPGTPASAPANTDPSKMGQTEFESWAKANGSKYIR